MTPVLDVRGLAYAYPDGHQALYGVDLHVDPGERCWHARPTTGSWRIPAAGSG